MPAEKTKKADYQTLNAKNKNGAVKSHDQQTLKPASKREDFVEQNLINPYKEIEPKNDLETIAEEIKLPLIENRVLPETEVSTGEDLSYSERIKRRKVEKKVARDRDLLDGEKWLRRNGHTLTYVGLYLFSVLVFFRPYELISALSFLSTSAFFFAMATLLIYVPTQFSSEGSLTVLSAEVKCILALTAVALITMPIAKDPATAWATFNDSFIKAVIMFIVMVNVLRTRRRLMGLMWLSLSVGLFLSYTALDLYMKGEMKVEGYRVDVEVKGLFGNPNDLALHLVTITPIALALALGSRNKLMRIVYYTMTGLFVAANTITFSRGGFLGLLATAAVMIWKLGRKNRLNVTLGGLIGGGFFLAVAPGNYGLRMLSIFVPALDPVGSSDQRRELLERSIIVSLRNPWGIGIGNFPIVSIHNLVTHNSFTQISSELGLLGLAAYLLFMIIPFRKLGAIERTLFAKEEYDWFYYLAIGLQASIVGYMVSGFFVSVAYNWFIYYLIAYAVAFRRIYNIERGIEESEKDRFGWQTI